MALDHAAVVATHVVKAAAALIAATVVAVPAWAQATSGAPAPRPSVVVAESHARPVDTFCFRYGFVGVVCTEDHSGG